LPTTYRISSNVLLSRLIPYAKEIIGDHQCGFRRNSSAIDHIFCIRQILEKEWEYNDEVHKLFIDFKKVGDSKLEEREYQQGTTIQMFIIKFRCLLSTSNSPFFGHHYAHHQEYKDRVLLRMVFCAGSARCGWLQLWGVAL